jgi:hypothetical protein
MLIYSQAPAVGDCRSVVVPACEPDGDPSQGADIAALACFQMRIRDKLDFTVDFSQWLAKNGNPTITTATFAVASGSPSTPTISGQTFNATGKCLVVLTAAVDAKAGDAYYLDLTLDVGATVPVSPTDVAIPSRTLVRRIHVVVING